MTITETAPLTRGNLIGGTEVPAGSGRLTDDLDPRTGATYGRVPACGLADIEQAVTAADAAFTTDPPP